MRTPSFWYQAPTLPARLLAPIGDLYGLGVRLRFATTRARTVGRPVICVGNLVAGGAGKTPVAIALAQAIGERGLKVGFLTRGHGGRTPGPHWVDPETDRARTVGDEPLLLAGTAPCMVARDRPQGAALMDRVDVIIMDDGYQNPTLHKDLALVVIDGAVGFGNRHLIPAGPLREPVGRGLARADAVVMLGPDATGVIPTLGELEVITARITPSPATAGLRGRRVFAFAGIGRPEKLFNSLREVEATIVGTRTFPDHHRYTCAEAARLIETAIHQNATPVTTTKDLVRLPECIRPMVETLPIHCAWSDRATLDRVLDRVLSPAPDPKITPAEDR